MAAPSRVSYNSYIVRSHKTALIDSVEVRESLTLFSHLDEVLGGTEIDYLVVNHMEPDHSGSIPLLAAKYPEMKIVGNKQTVAMIGGFTESQIRNASLPYATETNSTSEKSP